MKKREGFSVVEITIIGVVIIIIGVVGWMAYANVFAPNANETSQDSSTVNEQVTVDKESDLDKVDAALDDITIEDSDGAELDAAVKEF